MCKKARKSMLRDHFSGLKTAESRRREAREAQKGRKKRVFLESQFFEQIFGCEKNRKKNEKKGARSNARENSGPGGPGAPLGRPFSNSGPLWSIPGGEKSRPSTPESRSHPNCAGDAPGPPGPGQNVPKRVF